MSSIYLIQHDCLSILSVLLLFQAFVSLPVCYFLLSSLLYSPHWISPAFFLLLQNFLHKDHSLGCVIPPSHTSSFPNILLSDEGRSSLPFTSLPFPSPLSLSFLLCFPLTFSPSLSFSWSVSLFPFVSICGVKWGGGSQLSCACWLACAMCQAGRIMTRTHRHSTHRHTQTFMLIYIQRPTPHRPTSLAPKKEASRQRMPKIRCTQKEQERGRGWEGGREVVKCWGDENNR